MLRLHPLLIILGFTSGSFVFGQTVTEPSGVTLSLTSGGRFTITSAQPPWTYSGTVSGTVTNVSGPSTGSDDNAVSTNGPFDEFTVNYSDANGNPWRMQLRGYHYSQSVSLSFSPLATLPNPGAYGVIDEFPTTPHHFSNGGWERSFGLIGWMNSDSPWLLFDDQYNASILSPVSRPISQRQVWVASENPNGVIALTIDASNPVLPAGDVYTYLITFGQGIGNTFTTWGSTLRSIVGRPITGKQSDLSLQVPMLSTDAGASYYYMFDPSLGYEDTLQAAIASAKAVGIPFGVVHFDSWWYMKGGNCKEAENSSFASWANTQNGVWKFVMDPANFREINTHRWSEGFIQTLGPGMAHGRWVDTCSPYRLPRTDEDGKMSAVQAVSGSVIVDPHLWDEIARTLKDSGMILYEQDFLATQAKAANTFDDEKFLNAMSAAMAKQGINLQFCMPVARHLLQAIKDEHVHTVRVSGDRFGWKHWDQEMYGSIILNAGSVWPTVDNFQTTEQRNLLLAVLSAGPLALSDPIDAFVPIPQAIRSDGVILKPDVSLVPSDASFVAEAAALEQYYGIQGPNASNAGNTAPLTLPPLVGHTYSDFGGNKIGYVFAYGRDLTASQPVSFAPQDFGFSGNVYVYDYFGNSGWQQPATQAVARSVDSQGLYFVIAPVGPSGMAFLGDLSRFVTASHQRVIALTDNGQITATLEFTGTESVTISIFAASAPSITAEGANVTAPTYNSTTGLYQVTLTPTQNSQATIHIAPAAQ